MSETLATLEGVSRSYGAITALDRFDMQLREGEILAILGPNGAGKTTAVSTLLGITRADAGRVFVLGGEPRAARRRGLISVMLQSASVPDTLRVIEQIEQFRSYYRSPRPLDQILEMSGTKEIQRQQFGNLSGGQKQRVLFAIAIAGRPRIILLDEPTVGLDVEIRRELWDQIRRLRNEGVAVLLTTHYLEEAERLADRVLVIQKGRSIAEGAPSEITSRIGDRSIVCRTRLEDSELRALPGAVSVTIRDERAEISSSCAEATVRALLTLDRNVSELEVRKATLEEAFLALLENGRRAA